jgi:trans-aconitate methyltransferase
MGLNEHDATDAIWTGCTAAIYEMPPAAGLVALCGTGEKALDFGCGVGRNTYPLTESFTTVVGFDFPNMVAMAKAREWGERRPLFTSSWDEVLAAGPYDVVLACLVLQHLDSDELTARLRELSAITPQLVVHSRTWIDRSGDSVGSAIREVFAVKIEMPPDEVGLPSAEDHVVGVYRSVQCSSR